MKRAVVLAIATITLIAFAAGCGNNSDPVESLIGVITPAPSISATLSPPSGGTDIPVNSAISATFSSRLDPTSVDQTSLTVGGVTGALSHIDSTLTFKPDGVLEYATTYTATLSAAASDMNGNQLDSAISWSFTTESNPSHPAGKLYVLNQADTSIYIYDSHTLALIDSFSTPVIEPHFITFSHDYLHYYVVGRVQSFGIIAKYLSSNDSLLAQYQVSGSTFPTAVAVGANNDTLYMTDFNAARGRIHRFDISASNLTFLDTLLQAGEKTHDIRLSPDGQYLVSAGYGSSELWVADVLNDDNFPLTLDSAQQSFYTGSLNYGPYGVAVDANSQFVYVGCRIGTDQIRVFDIVNRTLIDSIMIPVSNSMDSTRNGPTYMSMHPDNNTLFVTTQLNNTLEVVKLATRE
ncbi:MAG: Ig-like domain-containing protein, partial [bacterium]|nr:Ig-like domain-containing protein [bacterium]